MNTELCTEKVYLIMFTVKNKVKCFRRKMLVGSMSTKFLDFFFFGNNESQLKRFCCVIIVVFIKSPDLIENYRICKMLQNHIFLFFFYPTRKKFPASSKVNLYLYKVWSSFKYFPCLF